MSTVTSDRKISEIQLSQILPNPFNPRTSFPEEELRELSLSISETGVIQAIVLRPVGKKFETVVGERRVRASRLAGRKTIPAEVKVLSDEEVMELALIENLQRSEVPPMEEAIAFKNLAEKRNYDVPALCAKFSKSEKYIRGRLALNDLSEDFKKLLSEEVINVGVAHELCKFSAEKQQEMYMEHFEQDNYNSWRSYGVKQLSKAIFRKYTTALKEYGFDKTDCANCPFNSSVFSLFGEPAEQGNCAQKTCLEEKNTAFLFASAKQLVDDDPKRILCFGYNPNEAVNEMLTEAGYPIVAKDDFRSYPTPPVPPQAEEGEDAESIAEEMEDFRQSQENYQQKVAELAEMIEQGKIVECIQVGKREITVGYVKASAQSEPNNPEKEIESLKYKDKRNKEIAREKIVADTKNLVHKAEYKDGFSDLEEQAIYFLMLSALKKHHFANFGMKQKFYLEEKDKLKLSGKLTEEQKTLIRRDFIVQHLTQQTGSGLDLLIKFARQHVPNELAEIEKVHNDVFDKRHKRLEERIKALQDVIAKD